MFCNCFIFRCVCPCVSGLCVSCYQPPQCSIFARRKALSPGVTPQISTRQPKRCVSWRKCPELERLTVLFQPPCARVCVCECVYIDRKHNPSYGSLQTARSRNIRTRLHKPVIKEIFKVRPPLLPCGTGSLGIRTTHITAVCVCVYPRNPVFSQPPRSLAL